MNKIRVAINEHIWLRRMIIIIGICCIPIVIYQVFIFIHLLPARPGMDRMEFPAWSPSGDIIAYECVYLTKDYILDSKGLDGGGPQEHAVQDICIQRANGDSFERLTNTGGMRYPSWSPNSRYLAWVNAWDSISVWDSISNEIQEYPYTGIALYHTTNTTQRLEWSKDGLHLFLQDLGEVMKIESGDFDYYESEKSDQRLYNSMISPSGDYIAYIGMEYYDNIQESSWWLTIAEGNNSILEVKSHEAELGSLAWSHNGEMLAWVALPIGWSHLDHEKEDNEYKKCEKEDNEYKKWMAITDINSGITEYLDFTNIVIFEYPVWSPDNRSIALKSIDELIILDFSVSISPFEINVLDQYSLPIDDFNPLQPISWSPTGKSIAYSSYDGKIHIINTDGSSSIYLNLKADNQN